MAKIACIVVLCMVVLITPHAQALTCVDVSLQMAVCVPYLSNLGPLGDCCSGVKSLNLAAITTLDRQTACNCLKVEANIIVGFDWHKAAALSTECDVNIPYLISAQLDCATVE